MAGVLVLISALALGLTAWGVANLIVRKSGGKPMGKNPAASLFVHICLLLGRLITYLLPVATVQKWCANLSVQRDMSGLDDQIWRDEALMGAHLVGSLFGMLFFGMVFKQWPQGLRLIVGFGGGFWYARYKFKDVVAKRQALINRSFPYALDLMQLCVSSGQSIGSSISRLVDNMLPGPVRDEFARVLVAQMNNISLSDSLRRMGARIMAPEIRSVLLALQQALERGGQISETLKTQTEQLRFNRLMAVEEQIQKLPTKMTLPVVLFFMPCTVIMCIGPIAISLFRGH